MKSRHRSRARARSPIAQACQFEPLELRQLLTAIPKIMPLGDSITEAYTGHASYRYWLWNSLADAGYLTDIVGSEQPPGVSGGPPLFPGFDVNHEGHVGLRADEIQAMEETTLWKDYTVLPQNNPDIVLLHIGTNDIIQGQTDASTRDDIGSIIDDLRVVNPNVTILLAQIIPNTTASVSSLNSLLPALVTSKNTAQSPVILVDQFTGFDANADTYDGIHPNQSGEQKIATNWYNALTPLLPAPSAPPDGFYLDTPQVPLTGSTNAFGPTEYEMSNGGSNAYDGEMLSLRGQTYMRGFGVHAPSELDFDLSGGTYTNFRATIGVDDEVAGNGSVVFQVFVDGEGAPRYESPTLTSADAALPIDVDITGATSLRLVVTDSGDGASFDHADWIQARLIGTGPNTGSPATPTGLSANLNGNQIDVTWTDASNNENGFRVERKERIEGAWHQIADVAAGTESYPDTSISAGVHYYYRVYAYNGDGTSGLSNEDDVVVPPPADTTYLSDFAYTAIENGWGFPENDRSNGELDSADGNTITLNGTTFAKGLGVNAYSELLFTINQQFSRFKANIGVDDEVGSSGSVVFHVFVNDAEVYSSPTLTGDSASVPLDIDITGANTVKLTVTDSGDGNGGDHADWADARFIAVTTPNAPTGLTAVYNSGTNQVDLGWSDQSTNEAGFRVERKDGAGGTYAQIADLPAGTISFSDPNILIGKTYFYRVYAYNGSGNSTPTTEKSATIPVTGTAVYLSNLGYVVNTNGWGPAEKDRSNGENGATDGHTITLNGQTYAKGIGVHAPSEIVFNLNSLYTNFVSDVGVDDEVGSNGSVVFQVFLDNVKVFDSGTMTGSSATQTVSVDTTGKNQLKLVVTNAGNGNASDHGDWANAKLVPTAAATPPSAPTGLNAQLNGNEIDLTWTDTSSDESGFRVERKAGIGGTYAQIADLPAETQSYPDTSSLTAGVTYYYRVYAYKPAVNSGFSNEANATAPVVDGTYFLSDLGYVVVNNAWGPAEKDRSNGESGPTDGHTITLNGQTYAKGIGVHAPSTITFALNGLYDQFLADVGVDDEVGSGGSVNFQVFLDNAASPIFDSGLLTGTSATVPVSVIVTGKTTLKLVVTTGSNSSNTSDHADWANARLIKGPVVTAPSDPTGLDAEFNSGTNQIDLIWTDTASNETGYRVQRKLGAGGTWAQLGADLPADTQSYSDASVTTGNTYFYRVVAFNVGGSSGPSNESNATVPVPPGTTYLSDLTATSSTNGWGPFEKDHSNGEQGATDGHTITLNGTTYAKGLGVHASSQIIYALNGQYTQFLADVGLDDEIGNGGLVVFRVFLDNNVVPIFDSGPMTGSSASIPVNVDLTGKQTLKLVVTDGGNGISMDHGDWAGARIVAGPIVPPPADPTGLDAQLNGNQIDLTWTDNATDETAYRVQRKSGAGGTWQQLGADLPADTQAYSDTNVSVGVTYFYRVVAINGAISSGFSNEDSETVPVPPGTTFLSDLVETTSTNGWGPFEKDRSNGESGAADGHTITLAGQTYAKGLGTHAASSITYTLNSQYTQFLADIGIDDEVGNAGSVVFQVFLDNAVTPAFDSGLMTGASATQHVVVNVAGKTTMRLVVTNGGNGNASDHADWANAQLVAGPVAPAPAAPTGLNAQLNGANVDLTWTDNAGDENGYRVLRKAANEVNWTTVQTLGIDAQNYTDTGPLQPQTQYTYRVVAFNGGGDSDPSNDAIVTTGAPVFQIFVSDLNATSSVNGWGPVERDRSNGETGAADGHTITLNGATYAKGLGVHAASDVSFNLNGQFKTFISDIGVDDEVGSSGSVVFQVYLDGSLVYDSGLMTGTSLTKTVNLNVIGKNTLRLVVTDSGNGKTADHADWAGAKLLA